MPKKARGLTARFVETVKEPGLYGDGNNLYLQVTKGGKSWIYRYKIAGGGGRRDMGLGSVDLVSLAEARDKALAARRLMLDGFDPLDSKRAAKAAKQLEAARALSFKAAAGKCIAAHKAGWKSVKHAGQWTATLETYVYPIFGDLPVGAIDTALVTRAIEPLWSTKPETAGRVRGRIEAVLDWARARGYRSGENPARWRGHLDQLLPKRAKVRRVEHHAALPYAEIGAFMAKLRAAEGISARALEFAILTAGRTGEVIGARWDEVNLDEKLWTIPADRMKAGKEHRVPLSAPAVALLRQLAEASTGDFVFPGGRRGKALSNMAMLQTLRRMGRGDLTAHGFRSTFRDWAAELTNFPAELAEMALAHAVTDKVEAAYRRGDMFEKRRRLMDAWGSFLATVRPAGKVLTMHARTSPAG
jgi:integrase